MVHIKIPMRRKLETDRSVIEEDMLLIYRTAKQTFKTDKNLEVLLHIQNKMKIYKKKIARPTQKKKD